jgi:tRNA nucleotidyltransferase (CCA-adding enzyme)
MKTYLVGGAVRDALLGLSGQDHDWVVVGATPEQMVAQGYLPVGRDFPVFLHPHTRQEHALARTERKTALGYHGFAVHSAPDVTLEQDLARRDLTINSIAAPADAVGGNGTISLDLTQLIDPWNGQADLVNKVLRHVTDAFREDPVRILRLARFAARFSDFSIAPETQTLMHEMVQAGEVDALVPERVWQELSRGLMEAAPARMFTVLRNCGALARLLPEVNRLWGVPQRAEHHPEIDTGVHLMRVLDKAAQLQAPLPVRWACLMHDLGKGTTDLADDSSFAADLGEAYTPEHWREKMQANPELGRHIDHESRSAELAAQVAQRLRVPTDSRDLADLVAREHSNIHRSASLNGNAVMRLLERSDALRKPQRFADALLACECDARGRLGFEGTAYPQRPRLLTALAAALAVATHTIAAAAQQEGADGPRIGELIRRARMAAVTLALQ